MKLAEWCLGGSFLPHGHCYLWRPELLWLHVGSDAVIGLSYLSIPIALVVFARRRRELSFPWIYLLFGAFILACGLTHLFSIWTTWVPLYGAEGLLKAATAGISLATAVALWPLLPRALRLPIPADLERANERYRRLNAELEQRVSERTAELARAIERLDEEVLRQRRLGSALGRSNEDLRRFASFLSHELRQPLNAACLSVAVLREAGAGNGDVREEALSRIDRALRRAAGLIEAELSLARVFQEGESWGEVKLGAVAADARDQLAAEIAQAGATVEIGLLPAVEGHETQLRQLFVNLLSNALRYRRPDVPLRVRIEQESFEPGGGRVRVRVSDNGSGFPSALAAKLFDVFQRAGSSPGSVGLGLAICKRIVERHGGSIEAEGHEGVGAIFRIELPSAR